VANTISKLAINKLIIAHVFLRPYERLVYFYIRGAEINLKLNGIMANEKNPNIPYDGMVL
jgi:hypothetical protein